MSFDWTKKPDRKPPESPLPEMAANQINAGGSAARKEQRDDLSDCKKFTDAKKHANKFPLGEQP